jgi:hypothetical protein
LRRAAHIVFLRIQVKHAQGSDLMRDPLHGNRPGPPPRGPAPGTTLSPTMAMRDREP